MSDFNKLSRQQLEEAATRFDIRVDNRWNASTLAGKLIEAGVTIDQIRGADEVLGVTEGDTTIPDATAQFNHSEEPERVVLKMERPNRTYNIMGFRFTHDHPFVIMDEESALLIMSLAEGFRIAHPTEAAKFYKGA